MEMTEVEVCARVLCIVAGFDPDEQVDAGVSRWEAFRSRAEDYLAKCAAIFICPQSCILKGGACAPACLL